MASIINSQDAINQVANNLRLLVRPGRVTELRALNCGASGRVYSGFFDSDHLLEMAETAIALEEEVDAGGVYLTLNPLDPSLLDRRSNTVDAAGQGETAQDTDVLRREWLLVDVDPVRPGESSATKTEKTLAADTVDRILEYLSERGWPAPLLADSGNGRHLLFRVDLHADDGGLVRRVLHALAAQFDDEGCKIDTTVHNAARLCRVYGTMARKGEHTDERPHRRSRVLHVGGNELVPREALEVVASESPGHAVAIPEPRPVEIDPDRGELVEKARRFLTVLPPAVSGEKGHNATFKATCALVVGYGLSVEEARPLLAEYNERCQPPWSERELEHKLASAAKKAQEKPDRVGFLLGQAPPQPADKSGRLSSRPSSPATGRQERS